MAYRPALDEGELHRINIRAIRSWIEANKGKIKAKPNKTVLYSGRDYDLEVIEDLPLADRKEFMGTPVWKLLERDRKQACDRKLPCEFETLEEVLKTIRNYPTIFNRDRLEQKYATAFDFFGDLERLPKLLPDSKKVSSESWERLSEIYASNAVGDLKIIDGAADDYGKIGKDKILIKKELVALLKVDKLSPKGKALLLKKIASYNGCFDKDYKEILRLRSEVRALFK